MKPKISFHAVQRYLERIKKVKTQNEVIDQKQYDEYADQVQNLFQQSAYVSNRYFFHARLNIVFVVFRGTVVTIYEGRKASEYEQKPRTTE